MTPRPCTWPDGGCGEPVIDVTTVAGKRQVLNPTPVKGVVLVVADDGRPAHPAGPLTLSTNPRQIEASVMHNYRARVVDVWTDHHATCSAWLAKVARERAARERQRQRRIAGNPPRAFF